MGQLPPSSVLETVHGTDTQDRFLTQLITSDVQGTPCVPITRVAVAAVFRNPLAGRFETDLPALFAIGGELGALLSQQAVAQLTGPPVCYGKAAIVGVAGDMEHG